MKRGERCFLSPSSDAGRNKGECLVHGFLPFSDEVSSVLYGVVEKWKIWPLSSFLPSVTKNSFAAPFPVAGGADRALASSFFLFFFLPKNVFPPL